MRPLDRDSLESLLIFAAAGLLGRAGRQGFEVRAAAAKGSAEIRCDDRDIRESCTAAQLLLNGGDSTTLFATALRVLFSDDEREAVLALSRGPKTALELSRHCGWGQAVTTRAKILLANLVDRRVLRVADDGYELVDPAVAELARRCRGVDPLPAETMPYVP